MNKKIINNAICAYLGLGILFLLPNKKEFINNHFVRNHSKTAVFIHFLMLLNYIVFVNYGFLKNIFFYGFYLNHIIASLIFLGLFSWILYGIFKAKSGDNFTINDIQNLTKTSNLIELKDSNLNEKGNLTIILSLIPFLGFIIRGKFYNYKSKIIENNSKLNFLITFFITSLFIFNYQNLGLFFILCYIFFIVFYSINLIINKKLITIDLEKVPNFEDLYIYSKSLFYYLKNYFSKDNFIGLNQVINSCKDNFFKSRELNKAYLHTLKNPKIANFIAYIPYINIFRLIDIKTNYKNHIINGLLITFLSIIMFFLVNKNYQLFLLFLIFYGIGYSKILEYRFPFLFDLFLILEFVFKKIFFIFSVLYKKQKEVKEVSFKSKEEISKEEIIK